MIRHHPSEATLLAYAAGSLPEALALATATHVNQCRACRQAVRVLEAAGAVLLKDAPPQALAGDALERTLARLDEPPPKPPAILHPELPPPLNRIVMGRWWPFGRGLYWRSLQTRGPAWAGLLWAGPGRSLPRHGHSGLELTCVLYGAFADAAGEYRTGDLAEPSEDHDVPPRAIGPTACLCVLASEGMRLKGLLGAAQKAVNRRLG